MVRVPPLPRHVVRGLLTFEDNADVHVSPLVSTNVLHRIALDVHQNVGRFSEDLQPYLEYHGEHFFKQCA